MTRRTLWSLRRFWRLAEAHWALVTGVPEDALEPLRDPSLEGSLYADALREKALDRVCGRAALRAGEGRDRSVLRLLSLVESENRERAEEWRERLLKPRPELRDSEESLGRILADMPAAETGRDSVPEVPSLAVEERGRGGGSSIRKRSRVPASDPSASSPIGPEPLRFQMAVDDGGECLVVSGERVTLGHSSAGEADIPVLADIESVHATFAWGETFHAGPSWRIEPAKGVTLEIDGAPISESHPLCDGDVIAVAPHLALRFRLPEAASASALLELLGGAEAEGAVRILLFARGKAGRVRIGAQRARHLPVAGLEFDVTLTLKETGLEVACPGGVRFNTATTESDAAVACSIPFPLPGRVEVIANARPSRRPPFGIALRPLGGQ